MDEWIDHHPPIMPVMPDTIVRAKLEDGTVLAPMAAKDIDWDCPGDDVLRYQIIKE